MTRTEELRERLLGFRPTDRLWGWLAPGIIALLGGVLRFWRLGDPHKLIFDETYYVKQGWSLILHGVEMRTRPDLKTPDAQFTAGTPDVFSGDGDMVVHPPVGKWLIGAGEWLFGPTSSFGWRFAVALLGTLSILMVGRIARRMFGSTLLGCVAAFLIAFEGLHFVMSRTGILDIIVMFWALAAFGALLVDRDRSREVLARTVGALPRGEWPVYGPFLGLRPWRWVAGVCLALSTSTKWSGIFFVAAFGLMTVWWDMGARRAAGVRRWGAAALLRDGPFAFVQLVVMTLVGYVASWWGWFVSDTGYHRHWDRFNPKGHVPGMPDGWTGDTWQAAVRNLVKYHEDMWSFSTTLTTPHDYQSNPWSWMLMGRPTSFFYEGKAQGVTGCGSGDCAKAISSLGTVSLWWVGIAALLVCLWMWLVRRDWRAGAVWAGIVAGYLPWFMYQHRTIFTFYSVAFVPWVVLGVTYAAGLVIGSRAAPVWRRRRGLVAVGAYLVVHLAMFVFFYPVLAAEVVPYDSWYLRMWFPSWI